MPRSASPRQRNGQLALCRDSQPSSRGFDAEIDYLMAHLASSSAIVFFPLKPAVRSDGDPQSHTRSARRSKPSSTFFRASLSDLESFYTPTDIMKGSAMSKSALPGFTRRVRPHPEHGVEMVSSMASTRSACRYLRLSLRDRCPLISTPISACVTAWDDALCPSGPTRLPTPRRCGRVTCPRAKVPRAPATDSDRCFHHRPSGP